MREGEEEEAKTTHLREVEVEEMEVQEAEASLVVAVDSDVVDQARLKSTSMSFISWYVTDR
jgi:hypothetical protein